MPTSTEVLRCSSLIRIYRSATGETHALKGVDAVFHSGTVTAITGPSGSGKSSLLAVLALQERPDAGELALLGVPTSGQGVRGLLDLRRRHVAWVAQRPTHSLFGHLTARQHLQQVARLRGEPDSAVPGRLDALGLTDRARSYSRELSGGEQQRLAVAMATLGTPSVIVADEPTAELDDESATLVLAQFRRLAAAGSAVVLATHDPRAATHVDRVLSLRHGVLSTEYERGGVVTASIDSTGRVQLPVEALALFADGRAEVVVGPDGVHLRPVRDGDRP